MIPYKTFVEKSQQARKSDCQIRVRCGGSQRQIAKTMKVWIEGIWTLPTGSENKANSFVTHYLSAGFCFDGHHLHSTGADLFRTALPKSQTTARASRFHSGTSGSVDRYGIQILPTHRGRTTLQNPPGHLGQARQRLWADRFGIDSRNRSRITPTTTAGAGPEKTSQSEIDSTFPIESGSKVRRSKLVTELAQPFSH